MISISGVQSYEPYINGVNLYPYTHLILRKATQLGGGPSFNVGDVQIPYNDTHIQRHRFQDTFSTPTSSLNLIFPFPEGLGSSSTGHFPIIPSPSDSDCSQSRLRVPHCLAVTSSYRAHPLPNSRLALSSPV